MTMAVNIFRQELKMHLRSVITWSVAITVLILTYLSLFPSFSMQAELLNQMLAKFPPQLLTAFGMTGVNLATVAGYFGFLFLFVQICLAIQAAGYGFSLVSVEEREWTADFLLAKPVGRTRVLTSKLLAALAGLLITDLFVSLASFVSIALFREGKTFEAIPLLVLLLSLVVFQLFFLAVGLVISLLVKRIRSVTPYAMALGFGMYLLSAFGDLLGEAALEKFTPFKHFEPHYILQHAAWDLSLVLISVAVIGISLVVSYALYARRNIPAVV
jgi:ABC-2 type transport system permease protein